MPARYVVRLTAAGKVLVTRVPLGIAREPSALD
jgi:hypothetical protein